MRNDLVPDLAECTEFRQTLQLRPPRVVHGTAILVAGCLAAALTWAALTRADLIVRAPGRVRPVTTPVRIVLAANADSLSATSGGRVVEVYFREGDEVAAGQVLVTLETSQLDSEIAKNKRSIRAGEEELAQLDRQRELLDGQRLVAVAKAKAELAQARERVSQANRRRAQEVRLAELELEGAEDELGAQPAGGFRRVGRRADPGGRQEQGGPGQTGQGPAPRRGGGRSRSRGSPWSWSSATTRSGATS